MREIEIYKKVSSRRTSNDFSRRNSNNSTALRNSQSVSCCSRRTSSVSDVGGMVSSRSSPGTQTPHVFISNSEICEEIIPFQDLSETKDESIENSEKSSVITTDSRRNSWKMYGKQPVEPCLSLIEPVGLFLLVPAVHTKHTVHYF